MSLVGWFFLVSTDCASSDFAKALLRTLRREQRGGGHSAMSQLVKWEVPKSDLVPLILHYRREKQLCLTLVKILVALTLPVTRTFVGVEEHLAKLQLCKELFVNADLVAVMMSFLAEPLSRTGDDRTEKDTKTIDLLLNLFHNLLHIRTVTTANIDNSKKMLDDALLKVFFKEHVMEAFVVIAQNVDQEDSKNWSILLTNILFLITDGFIPEDLSFCYHSAKAPAHAGKAGKPGSKLSALRKKEKVTERSDRYRLSGRHSHFGGQLQIKEVDGTVKVLDARQLLAPVKAAAGTTSKKKKKKNAMVDWERTDREASSETKALLFEFLSRIINDDVFSLLMYETANAISKSDLKNADLPSFQADVNRYIRVAGFFIRFDCVMQIQKMRLLENPRDIQRELSVLDKVPKHATNQTFSITHIETVLNPKFIEFLFQRCDHILEQKPPSYRDVSYVMKCVSQILHTIAYILINGDVDLKYTAKKTLYRIFLDRKQFLDRLPSLLHKYVESTMPLYFVSNLVETADLTFILIDQIVEIDKGMFVMKRKKKKQRMISLKEDKRYEDDEKENSEDELNEQEYQEEYERFNDFNELQTQDFTTSDYIRKFQHNKVVDPFARVLENYETNSEELNSAIFRMFERIRTGCSDTLIALPAIFYQARLLNLFLGMMNNREALKPTKPSIELLCEFAETIVKQLMDLTKNGANSHVFAHLLFLRSQNENRNFADVNLRLAYEKAMEEGRDGGRNRREDSESDGDFNAMEKEFEDDEILLNSDDIIESNKRDLERKKEEKRKGLPKKNRSAFQLFSDKEKKEMVAQDATFKKTKRKRELKSKIASKWDQLEQEEKEKFEELAKEDLLRYKKEMENWIPPEDDSDEDGDYLDDKSRKRRKTLLKKKKEEKEKIIKQLQRGDEESSSEDVPIGELLRKQIVEEVEGKKKGKKDKSKKKKKDRKREREDEEADGEKEEDIEDIFKATDSTKKRNTESEGNSFSLGKKFSPQEDDQLRREWKKLSDREDKTIQFLELYISWDTPPTREQIIERLLDLKIIDKKKKERFLEIERKEKEEQEKEEQGKEEEEEKEKEKEKEEEQEKHEEEQEKHEEEQEKEKEQEQEKHEEEEQEKDEEEEEQKHEEVPVEEKKDD